jgi:predicted outer membrane repeat protein
LRLQYATFRRNRAGNAGGAIYYSGTPMARLLGAELLFDGNAARAGGAMWWPVGRLEVDRGIFTANRADVLGGAIVHYGAVGPSALSNCLMTGNQAPGGGAVQGRGLRLINCTLSGNSGPALLGANGPGPVESGPPSDLLIALVNSIVTASNGANCAALDGVQFADQGHNLQFPNASCGTSIRVADPELDSLFVPAYLSPAFQAGDNAVCTAPPVQSRDVFGQPRPQGAVQAAAAACTIGAVEGDLQNVLYRRRFYPETRIPSWWNWESMFGRFCCG